MYKSTHVIWTFSSFSIEIKNIKKRQSFQIAFVFAETVPPSLKLQQLVVAHPTSSRVQGGGLTKQKLSALALRPHCFRFLIIVSNILDSSSARM